MLTSLVLVSGVPRNDLTFVSDLTWNLYLVFRGMHEICSAEYLKLVNTLHTCYIHATMLLHLESNTFMYDVYNVCMYVLCCMYVCCMS